MFEQFGYGDWTILKSLGHGKVLCKCSCGTIKEVYKKSLINGQTRSCGCKRSENFRKSYSIVGSTFGDWIVTKELGQGLVECRCSCGTVRTLRKSALKSGDTKSCGCKQSENKSITQLSNNSLEGKTFGEVTILQELGSGLVECRCSCGEQFIARKHSIVSGHTKSCGCKTAEFKRNALIHRLTGQQFSYWTIIEELGNNQVLCRCECGTERVIRKDIVTQGRSKSCGCKTAELSKDTMIKKYTETSSVKISKPREPWQIDILEAKSNLIEFIQTNYNNKPTIKELSNALSVTQSTIGRKIRAFDLEEYVQKNPKHSYYEDELYEYINLLLNNKYIIKRNVRTIVPDYELDLYITDLKIAVEFNGTYWHSTIFKDNTYHQAKTIACAKQGIRLIHIFEYEWTNADSKQKIQSYLHDILCRDKMHKIYGRLVEIAEISSKEAVEFLDKYHLQGSVKSPINIGCMYKDELVGVITLGKPRFNNNFQYEIHRLCWKSGITVIGGAQKLLKYFEEKYKYPSIITYSDISKFTGNIYLKLGFGNEVITKPGYAWVSPDNKILSRNSTQKHKLIESGLGEYGQTEDEIMESIGYYKIYDSGNIRLEKGGEK